MGIRAQLNRPNEKFGHEASTVDSWTVYLGLKDARYYARVSGTNRMYDDQDIDKLASKVASSDQTFGRPYRFISNTVHAPGSNKPIKGIAPASEEVAGRLTDLVEEKRINKEAPQRPYLQLVQNNGNGSNTGGDRTIFEQRRTTEDDLFKKGWVRNISDFGGLNEFYRKREGAGWVFKQGSELGLGQIMQQQSQQHSCQKPKVTIRSMEEQGWTYYSAYKEFYKGGVWKTARELGILE